MSACPDPPPAGEDDPPATATDWTAFRRARDRFLAVARPEAMTHPPPSPCPDAPPDEWTDRTEPGQPTGG